MRLLDHLDAATRPLAELAVDPLGAAVQLGSGADSRRARKKVAAALQQREGSLLPFSAVVTTDNRPWFGAGTGGTDPSAIVGDVRRGVRLRIRYRRSEDVEPTWQLVDPYGLLAKAGRWYLVADRSGVPRLYSLERLLDWRPTRTSRRLRSMTLAEVVAELTSRWEADDTIRIRAVLDARQLDRARRVLGSRLTVQRPGAEDQVAITFACREIEDVRQLLPFAGDLTVIEPQQARERIQRLATQVLHRYS